MSGLFKEVEGEVAIIVRGGIYRQGPLYVRNGYLYAKLGSGFVRLYHDGSTTVAKCRLDTLTFDGPLYRDQLGRLCHGSVPSSRLLGSENQNLLLGVSS